jgi:hypothetical protein
MNPCSRIILSPIVRAVVVAHGTYQSPCKGLSTSLRRSGRRRTVTIEPGVMSREAEASD